MTSCCWVVVWRQTERVWWCHNNCIDKLSIQWPSPEIQCKHTLSTIHLHVYSIWSVIDVVNTCIYQSNLYKAVQALFLMQSKNKFYNILEGFIPFLTQHCLVSMSKKVLATVWKVRVDYARIFLCNRHFEVLPKFTHVWAPIFFKVRTLSWLFQQLRMWKYIPNPLQQG
jgi:hypothetical protein